MANPKAKYSPLEDQELIDGADTLERAWEEFVRKYEKTEHKEFTVNNEHLMDIVTRVDQRKDYYHYFHKIDDGHLIEFKEVALECFWIVKFKPFLMASPSANLYGWENEFFALRRILSILHKEMPRLNRKFRYPSEQFLANFAYSLKYRDISKEAMIDFVASFAESFVEVSGCTPL